MTTIGVWDWLPTQRFSSKKGNNNDDIQLLQILQRLQLNIEDFCFILSYSLISIIITIK